MAELTLTKDQIIKITSEPSVFKEFPFLGPIKEPALKLALRLSSAGCTACTRRALEPTIVAMGGAFCRLVVDESKKTPNSIAAFRTKVLSILPIPDQPVRLSYKDEKGAEHNLVF